MTDRELLELAANAAGIELCWFEVLEDDPDCEAGWYCTNVTAGGIWNPLSDDGDALRLAVKLRIDFCINPDETKACAWCAPISDFVEETFVFDEITATRRAIVRAAAEIGKAKELE